MINYKMSISMGTGMATLQALKRYLPLEARKILMTSCMAAAEPVLSLAQSYVRVRTGKLKSTLEIREFDAPRRGIFGAMVLTRSGVYGSWPKAKYPNAYPGGFLEYGHKAGKHKVTSRQTIIGTYGKGPKRRVQILTVGKNGGKFYRWKRDRRKIVPPYPYMRPAFANGLVAAKAILESKTRQQLERMKLT